MANLQFVIAEDHPLFRDALRQTLSSMFEGCSLDVAGTLDELVGIINDKDDVDVILLDLKMPGVQGFSGLMYLRAQYPEMPVVVVSAIEDAQVIRRALDLGASGYIPKSSPPEVMQDAIQSVLDGDVVVPDGIDLDASGEDGSDDIVQRLATLTPQQVRVLMMLQEGLLNKQIAYELSVSEATVKAHVSAILQKLNVDSRTQAVILAGRIDGTQPQSMDAAPAP